MPYKTDKLKIVNTVFDRRVKLLPCQKLLIPILYNQGYGIRELGRKYNVDKRLIQFILFPERHEKNLQDRELRGGSKKYYDRLKHNKEMREHRRYKYNLLKETI
jgi:hypothetical protein